MNISMENPYSVITGLIDTSYQDTTKYQTNLGVKAVFHPNPLVVFLLIKVSIYELCNITVFV